MEHSAIRDLATSWSRPGLRRAASGLQDPDPRRRRRPIRV